MGLALPRLLLTFALVAAAVPAAGRDPGAHRLPADEQGRCRIGVEHMIELGRKGLSEPRSRPELVAKRRKLLDEWSERLARGEEPCRIYMDIQKAATTF
jgi:hypothetical protein